MGWLDNHGVDLVGLLLVIVFYAAFFLARYVIIMVSNAFAACKRHG